jgi:hypothetical protein
MNGSFLWALGPLVAGALVAGACPPDTTTPDTTPPSQPANLTSAVLPNGQIRLTWRRSTDDRRVTGYQVFLNGAQLTTVTATSFTQFIPPPLQFTYRVRAVDAAGNLSTFAVLPFGYPADVTPPAAPTGVRLSTPTGGLLQIDWTAGTDDIAVAGYRVYLNGALITSTSATRAFGPFHGAGSYEVRVHTVDGAGNVSAPAYGFLYGDPVPPPPSTPTS